MFDQIKSFFGKLRGPLPAINPIDFKDGLLMFQAPPGLKLGKNAVMANSKLGPIELEIDILSFDEDGNFYRGLLQNETFNLDAMGVERRKEFRLECVMAVTCDEAPGGAAATEDLSLTGARIRVAAPIETGTHITTLFHFQDPAVNDLRLRSEVMWCVPTKAKKYHCGIKFLTIEKHQKGEIKRFIQNKVAMSGQKKAPKTH